MIPFDRIYSFFFKSFNIDSETETIIRLKEEWVKEMMIIKRSWIFALKTIWIPMFLIAIGSTNIFISLFYIKDSLLQSILITGVSVSLILFIISVILYLYRFRKTYSFPKIENNIEGLIEKLKTGDIDFTRFFNQSILNQWIVIGLICTSIYFIINNWTNSLELMSIIDSGLLFLQWIFLSIYRKRMMDLEMDYNIIIPGRIIFVNQSWLLSSSFSVEWDKIKTISASYPSTIASIFQYGNIDILTEWDSGSFLGTMSMYYVTDPNEAVRLIQILVWQNWVRRDEPIPGKKDEKLQTTEKIGTREVSYDTKETVRDVLR